MTVPKPGRLTLVGTPLGNLGDLSPRAIQTLGEADAIVCEDTRRTGILLQHAGVSGKRYIVANEHTEAAAARLVTDLLLLGSAVAVVTDAGMPGISDPGERLVRAAIAAGVTVSVVPGGSAADAALVISGLPTARWVMEGFLPRAGADRKARLAEVAKEHRTLVLYEAPHRLDRTLRDLADVCGPDRPIVIVRELTKLYEEVWRGSLAEAVARTVEPRGEYVLVLGGRAADAAASDSDVANAAQVALASGLRGRDAADHVAGQLGVPRRLAYDAVLAAKKAVP